MQHISLPALPYSPGALTPVMSETVLALHHDKHHQAYVDGANKIIDKLNEARTGGAVIDLKAALKELSFHLNGHLLHTVFWQIMREPQDNNQPSDALLTKLTEHFGSWENFQQEFSLTANSVEGSGWAALMLSGEGDLLIAQIEKHNLNLYAGWQPILVMDVWEHAYYLDYQNKRADFVKNFWQIVNWDEVAKALA